MAVLSPIRHRPSARIWLILLILLSGNGLNLWAQAATSKEYQIKAAFLFNFAQFIEWPAAAFASTNTPFCIGILGDDPFGAALEKTVQDETIGNRKITVKRAGQAGDLENCQILFVSRSEKGRIPQILSGLDSKPILTISEVEGFTRRGGCINFFLEGTKVRFEINPKAAQKDGLTISSQLLSLGKIVQTAKEGR